MIADRYARIALTVIVAALVVIAARPWLPEGGPSAMLHPRPAVAQTSVPKYEVTIPKAWGKYIGFSNNNILLEAPDHTLRVVDVEGNAPQFPRIKMLIRWE
jgi:hypothetical protein